MNKHNNTDMKLTATTPLDLIPLALPFEYSFARLKKRDGSKYWFTPSGKGKIWFGGLNTETVGKITDADYKELVIVMKSAKADALYNDTGHYTDLQKPYTITSDGIVRVTNLNTILVAMNDEFEARRHYEGWESL